MVSQADRIQNLKAEYKSKSQENMQLRGENEALRKQIRRLKKQQPTDPRVSVAGPPSHSRAPPVPAIQRSEIVAGPSSHTRRRKSPRSNEPSCFSRDAAPLRSKPRPRQTERQDRWAPQPSAVERRASRPEATEARGSKRKWIEQPNESEVTGIRPRGVPGASSRVTRVTGLSRFARQHPGKFGGSGASTAAEDSNRIQAKDWQHRVSSIPRPSFTEGRSVKRSVKRTRPGMWTPGISRM